MLLAPALPNLCLSEQRAAIPIAAAPELALDGECLTADFETGFSASSKGGNVLRVVPKRRLCIHVVAGQKGLSLESRIELRGRPRDVLHHVDLKLIASMFDRKQNTLAKSP